MSANHFLFITKPDSTTITYVNERSTRNIDAVIIAQNTKIRNYTKNKFGKPIVQKDQDQYDKYMRIIWKTKQQGAYKK